MTKDFLDMVYLYNCGVRGVEPESDGKFNIDEIYRYAINQGVWITVFISIKKLHEKNIEEMDKETFNKCNYLFLASAAQQYKKNNFIHKTIEYLRSNGVDCCLLKGEAVSRFYSSPICRVASDTDLLIDKKHENKCLKLMKNYGYKALPREKGFYYFKCSHQVGGNIKIHISVYGDITADIGFNRKIELLDEYMQIDLEDGTKINTLGITDGAVYLMLHLTKHFLRAGAGIRQLNDLYLYAENYMEQINWTYVSEILQRFGFEYFISLIFEIGRRYFNATVDPFEKIPVDGETVQKVLEDIQVGGLFGLQEKEREDFYSVYIKERFKKFKSGSPENAKCLLSFCRLKGHRFKPDSAVLNETQKKRMTLIKELNMI